MDRIKICCPDKTIYQHDVKIRIGDLNAANHLGFDSMVSMLNDASAGFFKVNGIERGVYTGPGVIYADLAVNYLGEVFYGDTLRIEVAVDNIAGKSFDLFFKVKSRATDEVVALAKIGVLFFDYKSRRPIVIPRQFLLRIKRLQEATGMNKQEGSSMDETSADK